MHLCTHMYAYTNTYKHREENCHVCIYKHMHIQTHTNTERRIASFSEEKKAGRKCPGMEEGLQGLKEKGLQSRSATPSLLMKNHQCMKEEI